MDFFKLREHGTNVKTEFFAGLTTFMAMIYIIPTNTAIMGNTGMPTDALLLATAIVTIVASLFNGLFANTPVAMSVGMGLNAYFTFTLCIGQKIPWQTALGAVFLSGFIFLLLSFTSFRLWIIKSIPKDLRHAISAGIGCFLAFMGLQQSGIVQHSDATLLTLGDFSKVSVLFSLFTLILIICFWAWRVKGGFMLAVVISSVIAWIFVDGVNVPESFVSLPNINGEGGFMEIFLAIDIMSALKISLIPAVLTIFITQLFDSIGTITGVGIRGNLFENKDDRKDGDRKLGKTMISDAVGTCAGALIGTSTATAFVESSAGVEAGGRTGLVNVFVSLFFFIAIFFLPFFKAIPSFAIYPVLIMVGILMFMEVASIDFKDNATCVATFFIVVMIPFTYSITTGFAFGFVSYVVVRLLKAEFNKLSPGIVVISLISLAVFLLSFIKF